LRPLGVTLTPKPGRPSSQYTVSFSATTNPSIADLVIWMRGIMIPPFLVLPWGHIGNTEWETRAINGYLRPQPPSKISNWINTQLSPSIWRTAISESARVQSGILRPRAPQLALVFCGMPSGKAPSIERDSAFVTCSGTNVNEKVTRPPAGGVTFAFAERELIADATAIATARRKWLPKRHLYKRR
jgi:hypothetical protein